MESSDDEGEIISSNVSEYEFISGRDDPVSFAKLPVEWNKDETHDTKKRHIFLSGKTDNGLLKIYKHVIAWKFDLSFEKPEISVLSQDGCWITLLKPRKRFEDIIRMILITVHFLHFAKWNPQRSQQALWDHLNRSLSMFDKRPSDHDLADHLPLIHEAVKRDETLANPKLLTTVLEDPVKTKTLKEVEKPSFIVDDVDETDKQKGIFGNIDEDGSDDPDEDDCFDSVCAICDNGGNLYICDGKCMRSFHATVEDGEDSQCISLVYTDEQLEEIKDISFICKNCKDKRHQCFACGKLGSSDESSGPEVFSCANGACGYFYHPECVAKLLHPVNGAAAEEDQKKIAAGEMSACPAHSCYVCKELEVKSTHELQFAVCRRCPRAYHRKCLPREIALEEDDYFEQRAWEGLLPKRILIYCLDHEIDPDISTPVRNHIKFPRLQQEEKNNVPLENIKKKKQLKNKIFGLDDTAEKMVLPKRPKGVNEVSSYPKRSDLSRRRVEELRAAKLQTPTSSSYLRKLKEPTTHENESLGNKLYDKNFDTDSGPVKSNKGGSAHCDEKTLRVKPTAGRISTFDLDDDAKKRIRELMKDASLSLTLDEVKEGYKSSATNSQFSKFSADNITLGKVEGSVQSLRAALKKLEGGGSTQDAKMVCGNDLLRQMLRWKDKMEVYLSPFLYGTRYTSFGRQFTKINRLKEVVNMLHWYFEDGDMLVDFCCGSNDFSLLMKEKLDEMGKRCSFKNYDLIQPKNDFNFEERNWYDVSPKELPHGSKLIIGLNPPFALANKFINKALEFKPKLIVLIVPRETERLDRKESRYDLIWEDGQLFSGKSFYLPGSIDIHDKEIEDWNVETPVLYLWSNPGFASRHKSIAKKQSHPSSAEKGVEEKEKENRNTIHDTGPSQEKNQNPDNNKSKTLVIKGEEGLVKVKPVRPEQEKAIASNPEDLPHEWDSKDKKNKDKKKATPEKNQNQDSNSSGSKRKRRDRSSSGPAAKRPTTHSENTRHEYPSHGRHQQLDQMNFPPYHRPRAQPVQYNHETVDDVAGRYVGSEEPQQAYDPVSSSFGFSDNNSKDKKNKAIPDTKRPTTHHLSVTENTRHEYPSHGRHQHQQLDPMNFPQYHHHQPPYAQPIQYNQARRYTMGGKEPQHAYDPLSTSFGFSDNDSNRSSPYMREMNEAPNSWNQRTAYPPHQSYLGPGFQQSSFMPHANPVEMQRYGLQMEDLNYHDRVGNRQGMGMGMQDGSGMYHGRNSWPQTSSPLDFPRDTYRQYPQHSSGWLND